MADMKRSISFTPGKGDVVRDVDDELALQLELAIEELVATGHSPEQARAEAKRRFGRRDAHRADCAKAVWASGEIRPRLSSPVFASRTPGSRGGNHASGRSRTRCSIRDSVEPTSEA